jgi:hypothetical protein
MNIRIELVPIFPDGELFVVIDWNKNLFITIRFFFRVVELSDIRMLQGFFNIKSFGWVESQ